MTNEDTLVAAYREMIRAMLAQRTDSLAALLGGGYVLTHMTGLRQPARDWLAAIESGQMRYHSAREVRVTVKVSADTAVLVGQSVVTATVYGGRGTWDLQLTTNYARKNGVWLAMDTVATIF